MQKKTLTRVAVAGTAAILSAGLAVPAFAGTTGGSDPDKTGTTKPALTVDQLKARVDAWITKRLQHLAAAAARVAADTTLTDAQKADKQAKIQAKVDTLTALKAKIDGETSIDAIKADIQAAFAPSLADLVAKVDARVTAEVARLTAKLADVAANTSLSDAQKAAWTAKIQSRIDALNALKAKVDAETTVAAVLADLRGSRLGHMGELDGLHGLLGGHRQHNKKSHDAASTGTTSSSVGIASVNAGTRGPGRAHAGQGHGHGHSVNPGAGHGHRG